MDSRAESVNNGRRTGAVVGFPRDRTGRQGPPLRFREAQLLGGQRPLHPSRLVWPGLQIGNQLGDEVEDGIEIHVLWPPTEGMAQEQDRRIRITWLKHRQTSDRNHAPTRT